MIDEEIMLTTDAEYEIYSAAEEESESFVIDNPNKANWALKVIRQESEETERLLQIADHEIEQLEAKKTELVKSLDRRTGYLKSLLYRYFETVPHKETKTQETHKLLDGSLVWKKPGLKMVPDKEKLLAYCKENNMPEFVKVKEEVDWASYKKECEICDGNVVNIQTGDILPADMIPVEETPGEFTVKF